MKKHILVTGGAGFLGSHLCKRLLRDGNEVVCVDNFHTGSHENMETFKDCKNFKLINHDIRTPLNLEVDEIYNLACPASPVHYQADPIYTTQTCVLGTLNMLELAQKRECRFFQASTSEVYGDPECHPQMESYWGNVNPIGLRSCYDEGKRCSETLCFDFQRMHNVAIRVVRIFNTYGPNMHPEDGRVVSNFIIQALLGCPITVYGDGSQTRSFCFVDDLIEAFQIFMEMKGNFSGPLNLGNPVEFTVLELAHKVIALTGSGSKILFKSLPQDDPKRRRPDIGMAQEYLGWTPRVSLEEGLKKTIDYFEGILRNNSRDLL